jgi:hypothetical protein
VEERSHVPKNKYWESVLEDALDVIAKVARVAAIVYHNCYTDVIYTIVYLFHYRFLKFLLGKEN